MERILTALIRKLAKRYGFVIISKDEHERLKIADQRLQVATLYLIRIDNGQPAEASFNTGGLASFVRTLKNAGYSRWKR